MTTPGDALADELALRNLIARLSLNADMGDIEQYMSSFAHDACWNIPGAPVRGHDAIRAGLLQRRAEGIAGPGTATRHMVSTVAVVIDPNGTHATAQSYFQFFVDTISNPTLRAVGAYADTFIHTPEGWKLQQRDITFG